MSNDNDLDRQFDYTLELNDKVYGLTDEFLEAIAENAHRQYDENEMFECWWKRIDGDPVLVIETFGRQVPFDDLDELEMEMKEIDDAPDTDTDDAQTADNDSGNGMRTVPKDQATDDDHEEEGAESERTFFSMTPQRYEEIPQPDGDEPDQIPAETQQIGDDPTLVWWVPSDPAVEERWETGRAIVACDSWVEWNVQARADDPSLTFDAETGEYERNGDSHDQWESLCEYYDCPVVAERQPSQQPAGQEQRKPDGWYDDKDLDPNSGAVGNRWNL